MKAQILNQITNITSNLIAANLSEEQNFPSDVNGTIYISGNPDLSIALKNISYREIYEILEREKNYNIKMVDGALIQIMYTFDADGLLSKYRLAFFPSPSLEEFQNNSEIYELDEIYADILAKNIVTTPLRFDYDPSNFTVLEHPRSHLSIGQYQNCRIPVSKPITPYIFINFILRNFYNTAKQKFSETLNFEATSLFENCLDELENKVLHMSID
jgi:hypothetical protein